MICTYGACLRTDTRPSDSGDRCPEHQPGKVGEKLPPPARQLPHLGHGQARTYTYEYDQQHGRKKKRS